MSQCLILKCDVSCAAFERDILKVFNVQCWSFSVYISQWIWFLCYRTKDYKPCCTIFKAELFNPESYRPPCGLWTAAWCLFITFKPHSLYCTKIYTPPPPHVFSDAKTSPENDQLHFVSVSDRNMCQRKDIWKCFQCEWRKDKRTKPFKRTLWKTHGMTRPAVCLLVIAVVNPVMTVCSFFSMYVYSVLRHLNISIA